MARPRDSKYQQHAIPEFGRRPPKIQVHDLNNSTPEHSPGQPPARGPQSEKAFHRAMSSPGFRTMEDAHSALLKAKGKVEADIRVPTTGSWSSSPTAYSSSSPKIPSFRSRPEMPQAPSRPRDDGELERLREQLKAANEKLSVASREAEESKAAEKELRELRREARDALSEMADQNKQLVEAYMKKKAELRKMEERSDGAGGSSEREVELEKRLQAALEENKAQKTEPRSPTDDAASDTTGLLRMAREETDELRMANHRQAREIEMLQQKVEELQGKLKISEACKAGSGSERVLRGSNKAGRCNTPKTLKIESLDAMNAELREKNEKLVREHAEIVDRAQRREQAEAAKHEATCSFQKSDYIAAAEQYSKAITCQIDDAKYNAVLYLNRAACYQAVRDFLRCISDCCTAASLDPTMPKIYHRRADAYQAIQLYSGAYNDMVILKERLGKGGGEVDTRLENLQQLANKNIPVDHCLVLGVSKSATDKEVKTAYRRLSLVHHPDKVTAMERPGAETIFKICCEAHRVLTSAVKPPMQPLRTRRNTYC